MSHPLCIQMLKVQKYLSFLFVRKKKQKLPLELCSPPMRHQNAKVPKLTSLPPFSRRDAQTGWHFVRIIDTNGSRLLPLRWLHHAGLGAWGVYGASFVGLVFFIFMVLMSRMAASCVTFLNLWSSDDR